MKRMASRAGLSRRPTSAGKGPALEQRRGRQSVKERVLALQKHRNSIGTWVQCCRSSCKKWRYLANVKDASDIPELWYCHMSSDVDYNSCDIPEVEISETEEEGFVYNKYSVGSIVWAKHQGYPWWPAMVDDDPDIEVFYWLGGASDVPSHYMVVFLDEHVSRAWISVQCIQRFTSKKCPGPTKVNNIDYSVRLRMASERAMFALKMTVEQRRKEFCFVNRYTCNSVLAPSKNVEPIEEDYVPTYKKPKNYDEPATPKTPAPTATDRLSENESEEDGVDDSEEDGVFFLSQAEKMLSNVEEENTTEKESPTNGPLIEESVSSPDPDFQMDFQSEEPSILPYYRPDSKNDNSMEKSEPKSGEDEIQVIGQVKRTNLNRIPAATKSSPVYLQL